KDDASGHNKPTDPKETRAQESLAQIQHIIAETMSALHPGNDEVPKFQFHPGASILVVIGSREAVDVARKVVNALPGQRYGLTPDSMAPNAGQADEQFRRRYGLDRPPIKPAPDPKPQP